MVAESEQSNGVQAFLHSFFFSWVWFDFAYLVGAMDKGEVKLSTLEWTVVFVA
jgi:hypothetical protein